MKKTILLITLLAAAVGLRADGLPSATQLMTPPHLEFKYYGFYGVVDYTFMTNLNQEHGGYKDINGVMHNYTDKYTLNGLTAVVGWMWRKESAVGVGFSYLSDGNASFSQIPVFIEFRSHFTRARLTPFTAVQLGYSIPFGSKNADPDYTRIDEGGITVGLSGGIRFALRQKLAMNLFVGYQMIQLNSVERGFDMVAATRLPELYHNIKFGLGFNF